METKQPRQSPDAIQQIYEQFSGALTRQAERLEKLHQSINLLQEEQRRLEVAASYLLGPLEHSLADGAGTRALSPSGMLACMGKLAAAACAAQVLELLAEEVARMEVHAAVFDVRGRAAWGFSAGGFSPELENLRTLVVPLDRDGPFRQALDGSGDVETNAAGLQQHPNVLSSLAPAAGARILLIPVRSAGCVVAALYAETSEKRDPDLIDAIRILANFAGAQMDRLMAAGGRAEEVEAAPATESAEEASEEEAAIDTETAAEQATEIPPEAPPAEAIPTEAEPAAVGTVSEEVAAAEVSASEAIPEEPEPAAAEEEKVAAVPAEPPLPVEEPPAVAQAVETAQPTEEKKEEEAKVHRDARRFSKLLVSEIELYNKESVDEGRRSKDLYQRLKKDIDRSRETYEKRFAHTSARQFDYFHEELVRTLAENDPSLLGSGYPGPSV